MTEMNVSENLWNEDELLEHLEQMQDQIEKLQTEKEEIINYRREAETWHMEQEQKLSSEISALQLTLQQAQSKLQEQSAQIVKLNSADLILKENEQLKQEVKGARATIIHYENAYQKRVQNLEKKEADIAAEKRRVRKMREDESELIKEKAEEIANPRILTVKRKCEDAKTKMKHRHEEDTRNLKKWLLFLFAYAVSMTMLVVSLYASEVLNKTSEQLILVTVIIHGIYLYLRVQRDA